MSEMSSTADQLEEAAEDNKFGAEGIPLLGKDFNGEADVDFDDVAPYRYPDFGDWPSGNSGWTLDKNLD